MVDFAISDTFALQRSYIRGVGFYAPAGSTKHDFGNEKRIEWPPVYGGLYVACRMKDEFYNWNSNTYHGNWIFEEYWAAFLLGPHFSYIPFTMFIHIDPVTLGWYITNHLDIFSDFYSFDIPAAPPTYWLPAT